MDKEVVFSCKCEEPEGTVERSVYFAPLTPERINRYYEKLSKFPTLFNRHITGIEDFLTSFITQDGDSIKANGIIWEVDDVGLFFITDIYPNYQATGHFTFWDRRFRGREVLLKTALKYAFKEFDFHRIITEVPLYTPATLGAVERVGFVKEGRLRKATWYQGEWWDVNLYSILREESIENGKPN